MAEDRRKYNKGTPGNRGGRPATGKRCVHAVRLWPDEWEIVREASRLIKQNEEARKAICEVVTRFAPAPTKKAGQEVVQ